MAAVRAAYSQGQEIWCPPVKDDAAAPSIAGASPLVLDGPPPGSGSLFRCAICQALVFESQLDFHATICIDPDDPPAEPDSVAVDGNRAKPSSPAPAASQPAGGAVLAKQVAERQRPRPAALDETRSHASRGSALSASASSPGSYASRGAARLAARTAAATSATSATSAAQSVAQSVARSQRRSRAEARKEGSTARTSATQAPGETSERAASEQAKSQRIPPGWQDRSLRIHEAEMATRHEAKKQRMREELERQQAEQCTFAPQLRARRSLGSAPKNPVSAYSLQVERRQAKAKRHEAEMYADVTHRPKISSFAQAWAARGDRATVEGQDDRPLSVFDRLYLAATREREARQAEAEIDGEAEVISRPGSKDPAAKPAAGAVAASELLYSDAVERRQKQQQLEERASEFDQQRSSRFACSGSRRRYWQMLERQVREAFDASAADAESLARPELPDFLRKLGALPPPKAGPPSAVDRAEEEANRLCDALWRHLHSESAGGADLTTLTVFILVLMGAADEDANGVRQSSRDRSLAGATPASTHFIGTPSDGLSPQLMVEGPASAEGVTYHDVPCSPPAEIGGQSVDAWDLRIDTQSKDPALWAVGAVGPDCQRSAADVDQAAELVEAKAEDAGTPADLDNQKICELLLRFRPRELRAEFQQLCVNRMLHGVPHDKREAQADEVQAPELDKRSRSLADKVARRQRGDAGAQGGIIKTHADLLQWRMTQVDAKKERMRIEQEEREERACTFRPSLHATKDLNGSVVATPLVATHVRLNAQAMARQQDWSARAAEAARSRSAERASSCTFKPDLRKSESSYARYHPAGRLPRGYTECKDRLRSAFAVLEEKRKMLNSMHPVSITEEGGAYLVRGRAASTSPRRSPCTSPRSSVTLPASARRKSSPRSDSQGRRGDLLVPSRGQRAQQSNSLSHFSVLHPPTPVGSLAQEAASRPDSPLSPQSPARLPAPRTGRQLGPPGQQESLQAGSYSEPASHEVSAQSTSPRLEGGARATLEQEQGRPLIVVEVNIAPGCPPETLVLLEGQSVAKVAADFAVRHRLSPDLAQRLHGMLQDLLARRDKLQ